MLRRSEPERRRLRDDADADHARWDRYLAEKRRLESLGLEPDEYTARVRELAQWLGV